MTGTKVTKQAAVTYQAVANTNQLIEDVAFFSASGAPLMPGFIPYTTATAAGTAAKTVAAAEPPVGACIALTFAGTGSGNTANSPTVSFNGGTARAIKLGGTAVTGAKMTLGVNSTAFYYFDGTDLHQFGVYS
jgi:hypothetical protein